METPAWAPSSVRAAYRGGTDDPGELMSGRSWDRLLASLVRTGEVLKSDRSPFDEPDRTSGYRHRLVLLALGIDEALRGSDPYRPRHLPTGTARVDAAQRWAVLDERRAAVQRRFPR